LGRSRRLMRRRRRQGSGESEGAVCLRIDSHRMSSCSREQLCRSRLRLRPHRPVSLPQGKAPARTNSRTWSTLSMRAVKSSHRMRISSDSSLKSSSPKSKRLKSRQISNFCCLIWTSNRARPRRKNQPTPTPSSSTNNNPTAKICSNPVATPNPKSPITPPTQSLLSSQKTSKTKGASICSRNANKHPPNSNP